MNAAVIIAVTLNPLVWLAVVWAVIWGARRGVVTIKRPPQPRTPAPREN